MGLVDYHARIIAEVWLNHKFSQKHTIGHIFDDRIIRRIILKSN
jgi:hypothetical protein